MLKIECAQIVGWEPAIRGMRNPKNSWDRSDTLYLPQEFCDEEEDFERSKICGGYSPIIKENDLNLMTRLRNAGTDHRKFMRMITVYVDITAPLYWWKEADTYKVGTVSNSCSTMHKIHAKEFELSDFSTEHLSPLSINTIKTVIDAMNLEREHYVACKDKDCWWQMIQLLPSSYNQKRTIMLNYEVLANIYKSRKNHKLDEWHTFCDWIEKLPCAEIITG